MRQIILFIVVLSLLLSASHRVFGEESETPGNLTCPVIVGEKIDPSLHVIYKGRKVFFCCKFCVKKFNESPLKYLANLPPVKKGDDISEHDAEHEDRKSESQGFHDHSTDHGTDHGDHRFSIVQYLGKFHPVAVHLPIALTIATVIAQILALMSRKELYENAARFSISLAAISCIPAALLGWAAGSFATYPGELGQVLFLHRWLGTSSTAFVVATALLCGRYYRDRTGASKAAYLIALAVAFCLMGATGFLGGSLIYGLDHYSW